jgi:hypothetical protein
VFTRSGSSIKLAEAEGTVQLRVLRATSISSFKMILVNSFVFAGGWCCWQRGDSGERWSLVDAHWGLSPAGSWKRRVDDNSVPEVLLITAKKA